MYTDPQRTINLLQNLRSLGFTDNAFAIIHHKHEPIDKHFYYCEERKTQFRNGSTNTNVQRRLEIILKAFESESGCFSEDKEAVFIHLAYASLAEVPF